MDPRLPRIPNQGDEMTVPVNKTDVLFCLGMLGRLFNLSVECTTAQQQVISHCVL